MRTTFTLRAFISIAAIFAAATAVSGQAPLLVDDINYPAGALLIENGWSSHSGTGTNTIVAVSPGLEYSGYPGSGIGNAAGMTVSGEDVHRTFAAQSSGSVYAAVMVNLSEAATDVVGGYFFHLSPDPVGTNFRGRVFARKDAKNNVSFGVSKAGTSAATVAFTGFTYSLNTTYLLVLKYTFVEGDANDTVQLFINPVLPGGEPATATSTAIDASATDISVGSVALRQGSASTSPTLRADGIRVGTTWASVMDGTVKPPAGTAFIDLDGDGKTDPSIFRPSGCGPGCPGNEWWWLNSSNGTNGAVQFGSATADIITPADFTGDGKTDIARWRPSTGVWWVLRSDDLSFYTFPFGANGDIPMPADYDGDGEADATVFRPSTNTWYSRRSIDGEVTIIPFGAAGDLPIAGDFDGDGKADIAIYRPTGESGAGEWWYLRSSDGGYRAYAFGSATDKAVPADFTGDGKSDLAFWRPSTGEWFVLRSEDETFFAFPFGITTDIPVPGDYDGDGETDAAIFRPSENIWYIRGSTAGVSVVPFGASGDQPLPNSYVR